MSWDFGNLAIPINNDFTDFCKEISEEQDKKLAERIVIMQKEIEKENTNKPFLYFAIGTANQSANGTNPSASELTQNNILMQQNPHILIDDMKKNEYTPFILNIDSFPNKAVSEPDKYYNGVFPLAGTVTGGKGSEAINKIKTLFKTILNKNGKIFLLNAVADLNITETNSLPYKFFMFKGIKQLFSGLEHGEMKNLIYASSYLEIRDYFNLYMCISNKESSPAYVANLNVSHEELLFNNVFPC